MEGWGFCFLFLYLFFFFSLGTRGESQDAQRVHGDDNVGVAIFSVLFYLFRLFVYVLNVDFVDWCLNFVEFCL